MRIYKAKVEDVREIVELMKGYEKITKHVKVDIDYATTKYEQMVEDGIAHLFILEKDDKMIGGLGCIKSMDLHFPRTIAIETYWFVHPNHRGVGLRLKSHFEKWAKDNGCDATAMTHLEDSYPESLKKMYINDGYVLIESHYVKEIKK